VEPAGDAESFLGETGARAVRTVEQREATRRINSNFLLEDRPSELP
jgi:hypothetical protein